MSYKNITRYLTVSLVILSLITIQCILTIYQSSRYKIGKYDCSDMSRDCGLFFSLIGLKVRYVHGWYYTNLSTYDKSFHVWLEIDLGIIKLPFESTALMFVSPTWIMDFNEITITDYFTDNLTEIWGNDIFTR